MKLWLRARLRAKPIHEYSTETQKIKNICMKLMNSLSMHCQLSECIPKMPTKLKNV